MIKQLEIKNFQSHKDSVLDFHKGVNIILGKTDSGKTAVIRALRKLVWNKPGGDSFRSHWGGDTEIKLYTDNAYIARVIKNNENLYVLGDDHYKAFGAGVPEEISQALNFDEVNLQMQFDPHFLLTSSAGEVAAHFNRIAHLDVIDRSLKNLKSSVNSINSDIKYTEQDVEETQDQLKQYEVLDKYEADLEVIESTEEDRNKLQKDQKALTDLILQVENVTEEIEELNLNLEIEKDIDEILKLVDEKRTILSHSNELSQLINTITLLEQETLNLTHYLKAETEIDSLLDLIQKRNKEVEQYQELRRLVVQIRDLNNYILDKGLELKEMETQWHENMPETCPLCGTKLDENG